jgi:stage III sporulation protein AG
MDIIKGVQKLPQLLSRYRYPLVILFVGLLLLTLPGKGQNDSSDIAENLPQIQPSITESLSQILAQIKGVGKVKVLLTVAEGEKTLYQSDEDITESDNGSSVRQETIIISDADRNEHALIRQVLGPKYLGAIIVCQGADDPNVKWAVVEAVSKATGLGADRISVLKMK